MQSTIDPAIKFDLQQNYRRCLRYQEQHREQIAALKQAKGSRVWIAGLVTLLFALASDFFLGASAALFALYFYRVASAWLKLNKAEEGREQAERWFTKKGLKFEGKVLYFREDDRLDRPLDPFDDALYSSV